MNNTTENANKVIFKPKLGIRKNPHSNVDTIPPTVDIEYTLPLTRPAVSALNVFNLTNQGVVHPKKKIGKKIKSEALKIIANLSSM